MSETEHNGMTQYRVWPDGTVQEAADKPYPWMSDDYTTLWAEDETDALAKARRNGHT